MGLIVVLDDVTAGRIAAGEVVERPASVAKELVENSLDARASRVEVELDDGGRSLIRVADNGEGMDAEDARLAFERHATSKLGRPQDLESIGTYGFRGEALPSIGAVARVRLVTSRPGASEGTEVVYEGGRLLESGPGPAREGTAIWVRDLFFNTPARRQAMRSAAAETARVSEVVGTLALARPDVALSLSSKGEVLWSTPGSGSLEEAAAGLLGTAFVRQAVPVDAGFGAVRVWGLAGLPAGARRDGRRQYLFCNGRPISPRILGAAVEEAYRGLLETRRTPVFALNVELPPAAVDVNIHPAKTYVRFRDHGQAHRAVLAALRAALGRADLFAGRLGERLAAAAQDGSWPVAEAGTGAAAPLDWQGFFGRAVAFPRVAPGVSPQGTAWGTAFSGDTAPGGPGPLPVLLNQLEPLGQIGGLFIVAAGPDGLYLVDQHAADERVAYETLLAGSDPRAAIQPLAVPVTVELAPGEEKVLEGCLGFLREVGFEIEPFGPRAILVRAVPAVLSGVAPAALVSDFVDRYGGSDRPPGAGGRPGRSDALFDRAHAARVMAACKSALRSGRELEPAEMRALLAALGGCAEPRTCPHGRPTLLRFGLDELRRAFSRSQVSR